MTEHTCDALIVTCIDFRFQKNLESWIHEHFGEGNYDRVALAGGVFDAFCILKQVDISVRLHSIKKVALINHEDCGAYGAAGTPERHIADMRAIAEKIKRLHPTLSVETYFVKLNEVVEKT